MSEGNVPSYPDTSNSPDSRVGVNRGPGEPSLDASDWEVVPLSGLPALGSEADMGLPSDHLRPAQREAELQTRIHDLNRCNEVLLSRVRQLEDALEQSQQALQQEVERSQRITEEEKVAAAQSHSVAQLLSELEQANASLDRKTILAETLEAQLKTFQERSQQLDGECTALRQHQGDLQQRVQVAEETTADLRSRLQRQQRYTLQFKAALEKCLDTAVFKHTSHSIESEAADEGHFSEASSASNPLVMPRSERIQPWSAGETAAQADPQLRALVRTQSEPSPSMSEPVPTSAGLPELAMASLAEPSHADNIDHPSGNAEAEKQLWQDVERVVDNASITGAAAKAVSTEAPAADVPESADMPFTEPIPWGAPVQHTMPPSPDERVVAEVETKEPLDTAAGETGDSDFAESPSPTTMTADVIKALEAYKPSSFTATIPALDRQQISQASPSPIVHPLRPAQRKLKSLSAVDLPNFPRLPKVPSAKTDFTETQE